MEQPSIHFEFPAEKQLKPRKFWFAHLAIIGLALIPLSPTLMPLFALHKPKAQFEDTLFLAVFILPFLIIISLSFWFYRVW